MSSALKKLLKQLTKLGMKNVGKTKVEEFAKNGESWVTGFINLSQDMKQQYGVSGFDIQGSRPHMSSNDPSDTKKTVTIGFYLDKARYLSAHLHEDGTYNFWESRKGKGKDKANEEAKGSSSKNPATASSSEGIKGSLSNIEYKDNTTVYRHSDGILYLVYEDEQTGVVYYIDGTGARHDLE
ncbi:hypothetical protein SPI_01520 [Niveomyces insectorum RCEF 264]|uniref:Uncharacterized protein n=1 Tax=Niveomyces insectorum RCEF 264 TaxID=1081102 RepID=A0A167Z103_9HYPO|nr:hypothetical protein SPI_01520 [Niveomyces insectorum RCEF 264]